MEITNLLKAEAKRKEAEITYKKTLLSIENDEIERLMNAVNDYYAQRFNKPDETPRHRQAFFDHVSFLKRHIDDSRALMEEIAELKGESVIY